MIKIYLFHFLIFIIYDSLIIQQISSNLLNLPDKSINLTRLDTAVSKTQYYNLTNGLPSGYAKDGSVDYTKYIQKGIDENTNVIMPNFPVLINENGISARSKSRIVFQKKSALHMAPNSLSNYKILLVYNVCDVEIISPVIVGERNHHKGTKGEWGMGIHIQAARNITIDSPTITNCWGDGIYIGGDQTNNSDNIRIVSAKIDSCRRNGISITSGTNIQILNPVISNTYGTAPMAGIDIEPNNSKATIDNILISNPVTFNNRKYGIVISLSELPSEIAKTVRIKIDHPIDKQSATAFWIAGFRGNYENKIALSGMIEVDNPEWFNNNETLVIGDVKLFPPVKYRNLKIYRKNKNGNNKLNQNEILNIKQKFAQEKNISFD